MSRFNGMFSDDDGEEKYAPTFPAKLKVGLTQTRLRQVTRNVTLSRRCSKLFIF